MIVYVKNSNGVRQLDDINEIATREDDELIGINCNMDYDNLWHDVVWEIKNVNAECVKRCIDKIQKALDENKDSVLIHIYDEGMIIE